MTALREVDEAFCVGLAADMVATSKQLGRKTEMHRIRGSHNSPVWLAVTGSIQPTYDERANHWLASIIEHVRCT